MIEIHKLSKRYGDTTVVDDASLTIPRGGVVGIVGPNGAGKSTLLSIISRLIKADSGVVRVDGLDVTTAPGREIARRLSIMRQENHVAARLTVRDLVAFGRFPHNRGRPTREDVERVRMAIDFVGLEALADRFLDQLSGGQRQRAFVAMTLAQDADYALFDEPLNNLDIHHAVSMMRLLRRMADQPGKTVVIVLHDLNVAAAYADRVIVMQAGRVVGDGPPFDVIDRRLLSEVFRVDGDVVEVSGRRLVSVAP
ncbi:iron ABC transporter ATP-binding protein [Pleomorphomonas diazotrophica]|uniref:Iron ABC transporter ATP-binding protein n=1 Tax=Pleomorphomonas diazotrophica TaxID=1166257 RepID=A0A1I4TH19_9HYPH|nr:ATP-binding cassette domain-containing protein [Pleomorphomonas diazotrophica]PKR87243.1 iron ABC transporter ATP-binding protein [Pleomorphomonas diazotrophica]SFM75857.1 iron complex transport system ATP-binding protein [Pleomorphomonas diazotrophica]